MRIGLSGIYLSDFVSAFNDVESTMYSITEGDYKDMDEITSKDVKNFNEIIKLSKYIAENYSRIVMYTTKNH